MSRDGTEGKRRRQGPNTRNWRIADLPSGFSTTAVNITFAFYSAPVCLGLMVAPPQLRRVKKDCLYPPGRRFLSGAYSCDAYAILALSTQGRRSSRSPAQG